MDMSKHKELIDISNLFEWAYRNGNSQKMVECAWEFEKKMDSTYLAMWEHMEDLLNEKNEEILKILKSTFRPELINRIDEIISFNSITKEVAFEILNRLINDLNNHLMTMHINISLTETAKNKVIDESFDKEFGARPVKRYITKNIETLLSNYILSNSIEEDKNLVVDVLENNFLIKNA